MFRAGLNTRCRARLGTGIVAHNNSTELRNVQIRGTANGMEQWQNHRPLTLERNASEVSVRAKESSLGVGVPKNVRKQQAGAMLASVASLCPVNVKQSTSNHTSDAWVRNSEDMESSAESGESSESSTMSDGDSVNIHDSQHLLRSTSGASMVTTSELGSKQWGAEVFHGTGATFEENEDENEVVEDENTMPENSTRISDPETPSMQREPESGATTWTDDKHSSYLNSMEATFVRDLYNQQGLGHLGVYGSSAQIEDSEQDCVESRPVDAYGCCTSRPPELFELMQGGHQHKSYYRPHGLEPPASAVLANPWVRHFKPKLLNPGIVSSVPPASPAEANCTPFKDVLTPVNTTRMSLSNNQREVTIMETATKDKDVEEKEHSGGSEYPDRKDIESGVEVPEVEQGLRLWQSRLQICGQAAANPASRKDMANWMLKRPSSIETENVDVFGCKRIKSMQQELAQKDLEMLEQYVANQRAESNRVSREQSEEVALDHPRKVVEPSAEEPGPSLVAEHKESRKVVGRSAMDQVVPLLGRMDSCESKGSMSFPDLNAPFSLSGSAYGVSEPGAGSCELKSLSSVPDLNTPLRLSVASTYTTNQPTINFTKDGEAIATAWSPKPETASGEDNNVHEFAGASYQPITQGEEKIVLDGCTTGCKTWTSLGKHARGCEGDDGNMFLELQNQGLEAGEAYECDPQLSPVSMSNSKTWTWGLRGLRRRLHDPVVPTQQSRSLRDGIHFSDPVFRSSGQQV